MPPLPELPDPLTVHHVQVKWGQVLAVLRGSSDDPDATDGSAQLTIYRFGRPHVLALSPALYARYQAARGEASAAPPVVTSSSHTHPWRADLTDPSAPTRIALHSRGARRSWPEIHANVNRRGMHITVLRAGRPAAVFVPLDWPPAAP